MFTEQHALSDLRHHKDLLRVAEEERLARTAGQETWGRQTSLAFRLGHILKAVGRRLQRATRHETKGEGSPARTAAYER